MNNFKRLRGDQFLPVFREHEIDLLEELIGNDVEFAVVGGAAVVLHGHERDRGDLDLLLSSEPTNIDKLADVYLTWLHFDETHIRDLKQPNARLAHPAMGVDILTVMQGVATETVMTNRVIISADGLDVPVISRQHLLDAKRAVGEPKDLADIAALS